MPGKRKPPKPGSRASAPGTRGPAKGGGRAALAVALLACAAGLAVLMARNLVADVMRGSDPEAALAWNADDSRSLDALADKRLGESPSEADFAAVDRIARRALAESPLQSRALRLLGRVAELQKDEPRAQALLRLAADRWLYDLDAQLRVINADLAAGDVADALPHIDITLRSRPAIRAEVVSGLVPLALAPDIGPLAKLLSENPPWRAEFLKAVSRGAEPMQPLRLYSALAETAAPPTDEELGYLLGALVKAKRFREAYLVWVKFLPKERLATLGNVYNGAFEFPTSNLPFDWSFTPIAGAETSVEGRPDDPTNRALHVELNGRRIPYHNVAQWMLLPPGTYELKASGMADQLQNERGFWWTVSCADGTQLGTSDRIRGTTGWTPLKAEFAVPATDACVAQRLQLNLAYRAALEEEVSGDVWMDDVSVAQVSKALPATDANVIGGPAGAASDQAR